MTELLLNSLSAALPVSLLIALLLPALRLSGRTLSAKCRRAVWLILIIRLCVPFSTAAIPSLLEISLTGSAASESEFTEAESAVVYTSGADFDRKVEEKPSAKAALSISCAASLPSAKKIADFAAYIYVAGIILYAAYKLAAYRIFMRGLDRTLAPARERTNELFNSVCKRLNIRRAPRLYQSAYGGPMLCGFVRPRVIIPDFVSELPEQAQSRIFAHELIHFKRGDLWLKLPSFAACALNWYNPLVHMAAARFAEECELACDELVLDGADTAARREYGGVMLDILTRGAQNRDPLTTGFNPRLKNVRERFTNIMNSSKKKGGAWIIAIVMLLCALSGSIISCSANENETEKQNSADIQSSAEVTGEAANEEQKAAEAESEARLREEIQAQLNNEMEKLDVYKAQLDRIELERDELQSMLEKARSDMKMIENVVAQSADGTIIDVVSEYKTASEYYSDMLDENNAKRAELEEAINMQNELIKELQDILA